jgi:hypothetical protein
MQNTMLTERQQKHAVFKDKQFDVKCKKECKKEYNEVVRGMGNPHRNKRSGKNEIKKDTRSTTML